MSENQAKECDICSLNEAYTSNSDLQDKDIKPIICNRCSYDLSLTIKTEEFSIKEEVEDDIKPLELVELNTDILKMIKVPSQRDFLYCFNCTYSTVSKKSLIKHVESHKDQCSNKTHHKCDNSCAQPSIFKNHFLRHTSEKRFKCNVCDYSCRLSSSLKVHMCRHKCKYCDYTAVKPGHLKIHMQTHTIKNPYKCNVCDYSSAHYCRLKEHKSKHADEKPYKCMVCDFSTLTSTRLNIHMFNHTDEKPYKCKVCDYSTITSARLKVHMFKHTDEKPYKCKVCDFSTATSTGLNLHMFQHCDENLKSVLLGVKPVQNLPNQSTILKKRIYVTQNFSPSSNSADEYL